MKVFWCLFLCMLIFYSREIRYFTWNCLSDITKQNALIIWYKSSLDISPIPSRSNAAKAWKRTQWHHCLLFSFTPNYDNKFKSTKARASFCWPRRKRKECKVYALFVVKVYFLAPLATILDRMKWNSKFPSPRTTKRALRVPSLWQSHFIAQLADQCSPIRGVLLL